MPDIQIHVTLPEKAGLLAQGIVVFEHNGLAHVQEFAYSTVADIGRAIYNVAQAHHRATTLNLPKQFANSGWEDYNPDLEQRRKQLKPGTWAEIKADHLRGQVIEHDGDQIRVDAGKPVHGYYRVEDLLPAVAPQKNANPKATTTPGQGVPEKPLPQHQQLTLF